MLVPELELVSAFWAGAAEPSRVGSKTNWLSVTSNGRPFRSRVTRTVTW